MASDRCCTVHFVQAASLTCIWHANYLLILKQINTKVYPSMLNYSFGVTTQRVVFVGRRFETPCRFHLLGRLDSQRHKTMEPTRCSETSANKHNTLGNNPKTRINHSDHGESSNSSLTTLPV